MFESVQLADNTQYLRDRYKKQVSQFSNIFIDDIEALEADCKKHGLYCVQYDNYMYVADSKQAFDDCDYFGCMWIEE